MIHRRHVHLTFALALLALALAFLPAGVSAAVGHGTPAANLAKFASTVPVRAETAAAAGKAGAGELAGVTSQAAGWSGGILASEGLRRVTAPLTTAVSAGLASFLPSGIARTAGLLLGELVSGAAFKVGMDAGQDLAAEGRIKRPDWLEVGAAAAGMVIGGQLLKPFLGPIGEAIGSWVGWSLAENLVRQYRAGEGLSLIKAFGKIDVPRLALQAVSAEGAALVARPLMQGVLGLSGPLGLVAGLGLQIALTAGASVVANKIADSVLGPEDDTARGEGLPALERTSQDAYRRFVETSRSAGPGDARAGQALEEYRAAKSRFDSARAAAR